MTVGEANAASALKRWWAALREAAWLTRDRASAGTRVLLAVLVVLLAVIPWMAPAMHVGRDFSAFWSAARLTLAGHPLDAYGGAEPAAMAALFGPGHYPPLFYPPPALLLWLPFGLLPFAAAVTLWEAVTAAAYALVVRALLKGGAIVAALAFPAVLVCVLYGQNSLFSAALLGGAALTLESNPLTAGALIGVFAYKPQLAILAPLVFLAARRWQAFAAAAVTVLALSAAATATFGIDAWRAFLGTLPAASAWNAGGVPGFATFASPYAAIRLVGGSSALAWLTQSATTVAAVLALVFCARKRPGGAAEIALMVAASGLCVPFLGVYDLAILAVPGAWLIAEARATRWLPYERLTLALLYVSPFLIIPAGAHGVPLAPLAVAALLLVVVRRLRLSPAGERRCARFNRRPARSKLDRTNRDDADDGNVL